MPDTEQTQITWEENLIEAFLGMLHAKDGDLEGIAQLGAACRDPKSFEIMMEKLQAEPGAKEKFARRALLGITDFASLQQLPKQTFGFHYAEHMLGNGMEQLNVTSEADVTDDYSYMFAHLGETHDVWHVLSDSNVTIYGEIKVAAFSAAQIHTSRFWYALMAKNILKATVYNIEAGTDYLDAMSQGWIMGRQAKSLFGVDWREWWETPIDELRAEFNIVV